MSSNQREQRKYERSTAGLRDALFQEMEDLQRGVSTPHEAAAFANLASRLIETVQLDFRHEEMQTRAAERRRRIELEANNRLRLEDHTGDDETEDEAEENYSAVA